MAIRHLQQVLRQRRDRPAGGEYQRIAALRQVVQHRSESRPAAVAERLPGLDVIRLVATRNPAFHRLFEQVLERAPRIGLRHQVRAQQRGVRVFRAQRGDQPHMIKLVPAGIAAPLHVATHRIQAGLRGLTVPLHVAADHGFEPRLHACERVAEHPRLLLAAFAEHVVVGCAERGLSVADQIDRAHLATRWRAIARRQRQCR